MCGISPSLFSPAKQLAATAESSMLSKIKLCKRKVKQSRRLVLFHTQSKRKVKLTNRNNFCTTVSWYTTLFEICPSIHCSDDKTREEKAEWRQLCWPLVLLKAALFDRHSRNSMAERARGVRPAAAAPVGCE